MTDEQLMDVVCKLSEKDAQLAKAGTVARAAAAGLAGVTKADIARATVIAKAAEDAFSKLYFRSYEIMTRFARKLLGDLPNATAISEETVQDALLKAWDKRATWGGGKFRSWLYTITRNCFLDFVRRRRPTQRNQFYANYGIDVFHGHSQGDRCVIEAYYWPKGDAKIRDDRELSSERDLVLEGKPPADFAPSEKLVNYLAWRLNEPAGTIASVGEHYQRTKAVIRRLVDDFKAKVTNPLTLQVDTSKHSPEDIIDLMEHHIVVFHHWDDDDKRIIRWRLWPERDPLLAGRPGLQEELNHLLGKTPPVNPCPTYELAEYMLDGLERPSGKFQNAQSEINVATGTAYPVCKLYLLEVRGVLLDLVNLMQHYIDDFRNRRDKEKKVIRWRWWPAGDPSLASHLRNELETNFNGFVSGAEESGSRVSRPLAQYLGQRISDPTGSFGNAEREISVPSESARKVVTTYRRRVLRAYEGEMTHE